MLATKVFEFCASHYLPDYPGLCKRVHGHNYDLHVTIKSDTLDRMHMVMDFKLIKEAVKPILELFDHRHLNELTYDPATEINLENPTAERIIIQLWKLIKKELPLLHKLTLYETKDSYVEYWGEFDGHK